MSFLQWYFRLRSKWVFSEQIIKNGLLAITWRLSQGHFCQLFAFFRTILHQSFRSFSLAEQEVSAVEKEIISVAQISKFPASSGGKMFRYCWKEPRSPICNVLSKAFLLRPKARIPILVKSLRNRDSKTASAACLSLSF